MKSIISQNVGGDGAIAVLGIDEDEGGAQSLAIEIKYPLNKLMDPINKVIDNAIDKLEDVIPGDWDRAVLEPIRAAAHAELAKLIAGAKL